MDLEKSPLILSEDFKYVLDLLEKTNANAFITGRAGTGKSTLLSLFRRTTRKKCVVVAPTGVAALNVKGQTIHSFFGFPPRIINPGDIKKRRNRRLYKAMEILIIDEISMVRADLLDSIDRSLRINRESNRPFGGVQVVFFGDLFQLPPVVSTEVEQYLFQNFYESPYFFSAQVLQSDQFPMDMVELQTVYRQENRRFLRLLEAVRLNRLDYDDLDDLNARYQPEEVEPGNYITLSARNATVDRINQAELAKLETKPVHYLAEVNGTFQNHLFPTEARLSIKEGAQVMFLKNDPARKYVNGTIGKVVQLGVETISVEIGSPGKEEVIEIEAAEWEIIKYKPDKDNPSLIEAEVIGQFRQFPLKLAWAITIHKSQGKTFTHVTIDMGRGAFEHGQTYVALSRCRTLSGIVLQKKLKTSDIQVDPRIVEFYEQHF
ncbi:MAG: AAA family ATPase [Bacteroidota bacterium]